MAAHRKVVKTVVSLEGAVDARAIAGFARREISE